MNFEEKYNLILKVRESRLTKKFHTKAKKTAKKKQLSIFDMKNDIGNMCKADLKLLKEQLGI